MPFTTIFHQSLYSHCVLHNSNHQNTEFSIILQVVVEIDVNSCLSPYTALFLVLPSVTSYGILYILERVKAHSLRPAISCTTSLWTDSAFVSAHRRDLSFSSAGCVFSIFLSSLLPYSYPNPTLHQFPFAKFLFYFQEPSDFILSLL